MPTDAFEVRGRAEAKADRQIEGEDHAERDGLAVQQGIPVARLGLEGVTEGVAEVEERPRAGFALVRLDDGRLRLAGDGDRMGEGIVVQGQHAVPVRLQPCEELGPVDQAVFDDLGVARADLPVGQGAERGRVGEHQAGLVEGADKVLPLARVDRGLAAHGAVDLGEQRRGHLDVVDSAQHDRGGEAGQIPDDAAAERDDRAGPVHSCVEQSVEQILEYCEGLGRLARRKFDHLGGDACAVEPGLQASELVPAHIGVGDDSDGSASEQRGHQDAGAFEQAGPGNDVVGPALKADPCGADVAHRRPRSPPATSTPVRSKAASTLSTVSSTGPGPLSTVMSARA